MKGIGASGGVAKVTANNLVRQLKATRVSLGSSVLDASADGGLQLLETLLVCGDVAVNYALTYHIIASHLLSCSASRVAVLMLPGCRPFDYAQLARFLLGSKQQFSSCHGFDSSQLRVVHVRDFAELQELCLHGEPTMLKEKREVCAADADACKPSSEPRDAAVPLYVVFGFGEFSYLNTVERVVGREAPISLWLGHLQECERCAMILVDDGMKEVKAPISVYGWSSSANTETTGAVGAASRSHLISNNSNCAHPQAYDSVMKGIRALDAVVRFAGSSSQSTLSSNNQAGQHATSSLEPPREMRSELWFTQEVSQFSTMRGKQTYQRKDASAAMKRDRYGMSISQPSPSSNPSLSITSSSLSVRIKYCLAAINLERRRTVTERNDASEKKGSREEGECVVYGDAILLKQRHGAGLQRVSHFSSDSQQKSSGGPTSSSSSSNRPYRSSFNDPTSSWEVLDVLEEVKIRNDGVFC